MGQICLDFCVPSYLGTNIIKTTVNFNKKSCICITLPYGFNKPRDTLAHLHALMHARMYSHANASMHVQTHAQKQIHRYTQKHRHTDTEARRYIYAQMHGDTYAHRCT